MLGAINPIALKLGPFTVHWYGAIIGTAVLLALFLSVREGQKRGVHEDNFYDYLLCALPVAIICARIYYVVFEWSYGTNSHHGTSNGPVGQFYQPRSTWRRND